MVNVTSLVGRATSGQLISEDAVDALINILDRSGASTQVEGKTFNGTTRIDIVSGNNKNNLIKGRGAGDALFGGSGNDTVRGENGNDLVLGGNGDDTLIGGQGNDSLFGQAGNDRLAGNAGNDFLDGGQANDTLLGGGGNDTLVGSVGVDSLTGGAGADQFVYEGNPFANGTATPAGNGINVLALPDLITDFTIGVDKFALRSQDLNINAINFQKGTSDQIVGNSNVIVLLTPFQAAGAAAKAIADNSNITSDDGVFIYFNTNLQLARLVYSQDLGDGGKISVLANLTNLTGPTGFNSLFNFTANDFTLV
jgi:Ca2+-binding RTX toxin-like protein